MRLDGDAPAEQQMLIGYARVSTSDQNLDLQIDSLKKAGCEKIFSDRYWRKVCHAVDEWVKGDVRTNSVESVWSLLKRSVVGTYHKISIKHLDAYLDELEHRFNNRKNKYLFRDTLLKLVTAESLPYEKLVNQKAA